MNKIISLTKKQYKALKSSFSPNALIKSFLNPELFDKYNFYGIKRLFIEKDNYCVEIELEEI